MSLFIDDLQKYSLSRILLSLLNFLFEDSLEVIDPPRVHQPDQVSRTKNIFFQSSTLQRQISSEELKPSVQSFIQNSPTIISLCVAGMPPRNQLHYQSVALSHLKSVID